MSEVQEEGMAITNRGMGHFQGQEETVCAREVNACLTPSTNVCSFHSESVKISQNASILILSPSILITVHNTL